MIDRNMAERTPPRLASWFLQQWGSPYHGESLAGDLFEQYQQGGSRAWYWRQVAAAVLAASSIGFLLSIRGGRRRQGHGAINAMMLAFGVIALGVGTLTWADTLRDARPPACIGPGH